MFFLATRANLWAGLGATALEQQVETFATMARFIFTIAKLTTAQVSLYCFLATIDSPLVALLSLGYGSQTYYHHRQSK